MGIGGARLGYHAALDGLRGWALAIILCYHLGADWAPGGFLALPVFFVLSGFLITSLLLEEREHQGKLCLRAFWARRVRRLVPAGAAGVALAAGLSAAGLLHAGDRLRGDVLAALAQFANLRFLFGGVSYADHASGPSPVLHYWSLSVEEHAYLVLVLVVVVFAASAAATAGRLPGLLDWRPVALVFAAVAVAATGLSALIGRSHGVDAVYYATWTRIGEIAVGAVLGALLFADRRHRGRRPPDRLRIAVLDVAAIGAAASLFVLFHRTDLLGGAVEGGGLLLTALLAAVVVAAAVHPGRVAGFLAWRPAVALGLISYGFYVFHWPVFLALTPDRVGHDGLVLSAVRLGATLLVAIASYRLLEEPIRNGRLRVGARTAVAAALPVATAIVVVVAGALAPAANPAADLERAFAAFEEAGGAPAGASVAGGPAPGTAAATTSPAATAPLLAAPAGSDVAAGGASAGVTPSPPPPATSPAGTPPTAPAVEAPPAVAFFGDSTAAVAGEAFADWAAATGAAFFAGGEPRPGCGIGRGGWRIHEGREVAVDHRCPDWTPLWSAYLDSHPVDLAVVLAGPHECEDRMPPGADRYGHLGEPFIDDHVRAELLAATDLLASRGARVIWVTSPPIAYGRNFVIPVDEPANDPARMARYNELLREVAALRPGTAAVVELADYLASLPGGAEDWTMRPDGLHFTGAAAQQVTAEYLGPAIVAHAA